jgi:hypothetical protein
MCHSNPVFSIFMRFKNYVNQMSANGNDGDLLTLIMFLTLQYYICHREHTKIYAVDSYRWHGCGGTRAKVTCDIDVCRLRVQTRPRRSALEAARLLT